MQKYTIGIYSIADIKFLDITTDVDGVDLNQSSIIRDLKAILTGHPLTPEGAIIITQVDKSHDNNLPKLIDAYKGMNMPQLNALPSLFMKEIGMGNYYAITLNRQLDNVETMALMNQLDSMQNGRSYKEMMKRDHDLFGDLLANYQIHANDGSGRVEIGPKDKTKRICRYCHKGIPDTKFDEVAHTISEGFGNKGIITNDECDACNGYFGQEVEPALIEYLDFFRVFYGVQGKKGKIHHKYGGNYEMVKTDDDNLKLDVVASDEEIAFMPAEKPGPLKLKSHQAVAKQDIYRSLVKYALGILQPGAIDEFANTIEWLRGNKDIDRLPLVRLEISAQYNEQPTVAVMIRTSGDIALPYAVSEINIMNIRFLIIIPMCDERDVPFLDNSYWDKFVNVFKMYGARNWQLQDFSEKEKKVLTMNVNFVEKS